MVCPNCGSSERKIDEATQLGVRLSDHAMITKLTDGQPVGFSESERQDVARGANYESDGTIVLDLRGKPPQNEQDTGFVCKMVVDALNAAGRNIALMGTGQADDDYVISDEGKMEGIQVVRALTDRSFWARLARTRQVSQLRITVEDALEALKAAIEHKTAPGAIPPSQRPSLTLALDASRLPALALGPVVTKFREELGEWTRSLGFKAVFIVGPESNFVERLD